MKDYQVMPPLTDEEYAELKADIAERGVQVAIEFDQDGNVIDGYHRFKICQELGWIDENGKVLNEEKVDWNVRIYESEEERFTQARKLNLARRHLTQEQKGKLIDDDIIANPDKSIGQTAEDLDVSKSTVWLHKKDLVESGQVFESNTSKGADGKTYPAHRKPPVIRHPSSRDAEALKDPDIQQRLVENDGMNVAGAIREQKRERLASMPVEESDIEISVTSIDNGYRIDCEESGCGEIYNMDCLAFMENMPDESVDLIIADPPYFEVWGEFDFKWESEAEYLDWIFKCLIEFNRILKPSGTLMLWGALGKGRLTLCKVALWIEENNLFTLQNWITQRNTRGNGAEKNYMSCREEVLFFTKTDSYTFNIPYTDEISDRADLGANGKPRENDYKRASNVWCDIAEASQSSIERCFHPTVKALGLCDRIIRTHSDKNDIVFIPFTGSGSEVVSCIKNNRKFFGTEIDEGYFTQSIDRIKDLLRGGAA